MRQGTDWLHGFKVPFDTSEVESVMVVYAQNYEEVLCKGTEDCRMEGNEIKLVMSQEETFLFDHRRDLQMQLRVKHVVNGALASGIITDRIKRCLNREVLT